MPAASRKSSAKKAAVKKSTGKDAIALLKADHRKVEKLFAAYEKAKGADKKRTLARQICTELVVHTSIEEEIFYPACRGEAKDSTVNEAYVEHDGAKVLVTEIEAGDPDDEFFDAKVKVLSEEIKHHVKEEERPGGLFAQAKKAGLDMADLGKKLKARKQQLLTGIEADGLPQPEPRTFREVELGGGARAEREDGRSKRTKDEGVEATISAN
ncbi:MAG TPA: hemerythrin domain-containing protein [Caulobacteraceae bacterium]|jgi:hemerythrin superfamily protein